MIKIDALHAEILEQKVYIWKEPKLAALQKGSAKKYFDHGNAQGPHTVRKVRASQW